MLPLRLLPLLGPALCFASPALAQVGTVRVAAGLESPTYLTAAPGDATRLFVTERFGDVEILDAATGAPRAMPFLSVPGAERAGLQGMTFHPDYASNGFVYVYYYGAGLNRLVRYTRSANDPDRADPASAHPIFSSDQSFDGHTGGWVAFGPDGYLYAANGDGGQQHDQLDNGQSTEGELMGNLLRLDVDGDDFPGDPDRNYAIPPGNPFVDEAGEDEIWAYGLRNPYRGCFDRLTGDLYLADVGQDTREEVNFQAAGSPGGQNYGWRLREGSIATPTGGIGGPQPPDGVDPIYEYGHGTDPDQGYSITGGCVYRGPVVPLRGRYFFGDYVSERIWSLVYDPVGGEVVEFIDWTDAFVPDVGSIDSIVGFGEDAVGNLYVVDLGGEIFRLVGPSAPEVPALAVPLAALLAAALLGLSFRRTRRATRSCDPGPRSAGGRRDRADR